MKKLTKEELNQILQNHKAWLEYATKGQRADLHGADLHGADLHGADLRGATLHGADLREAYLHGADLRGAYLRGANLREADLHGAYLREADLRGADLREADLREADLRGANLHGANLRGANLDYSCLPLWCGSLFANFDDCQIIQIAYHMVRAGLQSSNINAETKSQLKKLIPFANQFHRVDECGLIQSREDNE